MNAQQKDWEHTFMVKYASGILPTRKNMVRRKHIEDSKCPSCQCEENTEHILECESSTREEVFKSELSKLSEYLANITSWEIRGAIIYIINAFRYQREPHTHHNWSNNIVQLVYNQYDMGQRAFFSGLWNEQWVQEQNEYQKTLKSRKHGITVIANIIRRIQQVLREIWYSRNESLHKDEDSRINKTKIEKIKQRIREVFRRRKIVPIRQLAQADRIYFKRKKKSVKKMRLNLRERWVTDAEIILDKYDTENQSEQVRTFRAYFMHRDDG